MKKQYLLYIAIMLTAYACTTSKNSNTGSNNGTPLPPNNVAAPEKKVEKSAFSENSNKESIPTQTTEQRMMSKKKNNIPTRRTYEAIPSVPDTL